MKLLTRSLSLLTIASLVLFFANCGGDGGEESSAEQKELAKFKKTWTLTTATLEGDSRTADFAGFKLVIGGNYNEDSPEGPYTYSIQETSEPDPSPWPDSGTWIFSSITSGNVTIVRDPDTDDETPMSYTINSNGDLILTVNVPEGLGWRTAQVEGEWVFTFTD